MGKDLREYLAGIGALLLALLCCLIPLVSSLLLPLLVSLAGWALLGGAGLVLGLLIGLWLWRRRARAQAAGHPPEEGGASGPAKG